MLANLIIDLSSILLDWERVYRVDAVLWWLASVGIIIKVLTSLQYDRSTASMQFVSILNCDFKPSNVGVQYVECASVFLSLYILHLLDVWLLEKIEQFTFYFAFCFDVTVWFNMNKNHELLFLRALFKTDEWLISWKVMVASW